MRRSWISWTALLLALGAGLLVFPACGDSDGGPDPAIVMQERDLLVNRLRVGDVRLEQGDLPGALEAFEESRAIAERGAARDPTNPSWQRDLAVIHFRLSYARKEAGALEEAREHGRTCVALYRRLAEENPAWRGALEKIEAYLETLAEEGG